MTHCKGRGQGRTEDLSGHWLWLVANVPGQKRPITKVGDPGACVDTKCRALAALDQVPSHGKCAQWTACIGPCRALPRATLRPIPWAALMGAHSLRAFFFGWGSACSRMTAFA